MSLLYHAISVWTFFGHFHHVIGKNRCLVENRIDTHQRLYREDRKAAPSIEEKNVSILDRFERLCDRRAALDSLLFVFLFLLS